MSITSAQIRAAKALLRWSGEELAAKSGVSLSSIRRMEAADGVPLGQTLKTITSIKSAFEAAGVEFIGSPEENPGVRLRTGSKGS